MFLAYPPPCTVARMRSAARTGVRAVSAASPKPDPRTALCARQPARIPKETRAPSRP